VKSSDDATHDFAVMSNTAASECAIMRTGRVPVGISYRAKLPSKKIMMLPSVRMRPHKYVRRIPK